MSTEIVNLTGGLYRFLLSAEPALLTRRPANGQVAGQLAERARSLAQSFSEAKERANQLLAAKVSDVSCSLRELVAKLEARPERRELRDVWSALSRNYEALVKAIKQRRLAVPSDVQLGHVKPRNLWRNAFHLSMGLTAVLLYELVLTRGQMMVLGLGLLGFFVVLDISRRLSPAVNERLMHGVFGKISRPNEAHRIPSATWYLTALVLGLITMPQHAIELGTLVLAAGDPVASLVGKRWGRRKLINDKSLAGSLAFVAASTIVGTLFLSLVLPDLSLARIVASAAAVGCAGAAAELLSTRLDDNLTIPLVSGLATALLLGIF